MPFDRLKRRDFITLLGAAAGVVVTAPLLAAGQDYPNRPVMLIVNFPPGGSTDAMARIIREPLVQALGQSIIIDNRGGAGGTTGAAAVANAKPDGYTLLLSVNSALTTNRYLQKNFPFDPKTAFSPITLTSDVALVLAVHPSLPVHDVTGLIEYARKNPGKLAYATPGIGSSHHICGELLKQKVGIDMVHVPYRGGALAMQDLLAGNVKVGFSTLPVALPQAQAGGIRVIAAAEKTRLPELPDTPTIDETVSRRHQRRLEWPAGAGRSAGADHRQAQCSGGGGAEDAGHYRQNEASGPAPTEQHACGIRQPPRQRGRPLGEGHSIDWHSARIADGCGSVPLVRVRHQRQMQRDRGEATRILPSLNVKTARSWRGIVPFTHLAREGRMTVTIGRRELLAALGGAAAAWPLAARAQQVERTRRIGARLAAFTQALSQLGWSEGRNLRIDARWATAGDVHRHAAELVALPPDVLL